MHELTSRKDQAPPKGVSHNEPLAWPGVSSTCAYQLAEHQPGVDQRRCPKYSVKGWAAGRRADRQLWCSVSSSAGLLSHDRLEMGLRAAARMPPASGTNDRTLQLVGFAETQGDRRLS